MNILVVKGTLRQWVVKVKWNLGPVRIANCCIIQTHSNHFRESDKYTLMLMQWGQFVDHDITHTPTVRGEDETGIQCCSDDGETLAKRDRHRACFPIDIPDNDRMFSKVT